jgi:acyl transferase domain-containing protein
MSNQAMSNQLDGTEIAIIGYTGRFPGAKNTEAFWRNLRDGVESVSFLTERELDALGVAPSVRDEANYVRAAAMLDDLEMFDASFFGYSPKEAEIIDPQHRIFLECAWEALENAGYNSESYEGAIGVYGGATINTYLLCHLASRPEIINSLDLTQINIANGGDFLTTRVSYKLNLKGPSHLVQSACSTSLVAVHLACQNLLDEECDMALAGGVSVNVKFRAGYHYQDGGIVSPDGHCRPFDAQGQGTIFGSGAGIVVLKRLEDALRDRDTVHAVIKGSAVNNDGSLKVGYTAPSVYGQAEVISEALANAGVEADSISYIEAHGTATPLGDPVEIAALTKAFRASTQQKQFCGIGSVKSNIGHLDAAAGVASLIKAVLALKHRQLPPSLNFNKPNPKCELSESPFYVNAELSEWKTRKGVRRAGVSSFGVGGTNAHLILEEAPQLAWEKEAEKCARETELLLLSAKSEQALDDAAQRLAAHLGSVEGQRLRDVAYTLQAGRQHFNHRRAVVCRTLPGAVEVLSSGDPRYVFSREHDGSQPVVAFLFPGQGSQHIHMARGLYHARPVFRRHLDRCAEALLPLLDLDLRSLLYPSTPDADAAAKKLQQTRFAQPALFSVEYALAQMWMEWGVRPALMLGHSLGEYVAACVAGVLSLEDALKLVAVRGRLMQPLAGGAMLAVALGEAEVTGLARDGISIAALNGAQQSVLSGRAQAIAGVEEKLRATGVECRRLPTEHAFHSQMMEPMIAEFREELRKVKLREPELEYVSNVTGLKVKREEAVSEEYWVEHVRSAVRFGAGVEELLKNGATLILEVGPGESLSRLVRRQRSATGRDVLATLPAQTATARTGATAETETTAQTETEQAAMQRREEEDETQLQRAVGKLWGAGAAIDWAAMHRPARPRRVALPTYPFQRQRYWVEADAQPGAMASDGHRHATGTKRAATDAIGELDSRFYLPSWKRTLAPATPSSEELSEYEAWIILSDGRGVGAELERRLREMGQRVVLVAQGERYERVEAEQYRVRGGEREDFARLLGEVLGSEREEGEGRRKGLAVVHLWSLGEAHEARSEQREREVAGDNNSSEWEKFERAQACGYYSLLALAQAVEQERIGVPVRIVVAANKLHSITSEEISTPQKATILGPCRVIPQEHSNITCRCVDVVVGESGSRQEKRLINQLLGESREGSHEVVVAYRGDQRWVQSFEPVEHSSERAAGEKLRAGGVYLVLGGAEDACELFASRLCQSAGAKLVLVTRRGLPPRDEWQTILQHGGSSIEHEGDGKSSVAAERSERRQIEWVKRLEEQGAQVEALAADVSDEAQLRRVVEFTETRFGALHGVVHAAESLVEMSFSPVGSTGRAESDWQFRAKAGSLSALEKVLGERELDFCLVFTSLSNILGGPGYVAQAAANAFVSSFVQNHNRRGPVLWTNVNWDGRRVEETKEPGALDNLRGSGFGLTADGGVEAFGRILAMQAATELVVSNGDLQARIEQWAGSESSREQAAGQTSAAVSSLHPRPKLQSTYVAPANELEQAIASVWQRALGIEPVGVEDNFFELGGDSLIAIQVIADLKRELKQEIPIVSLYEGLTIKSLVGLLEASRREEAGAEGLETEQADEREERTMRRKLYQQKQRFKRKEAIG